MTELDPNAPPRPSTKKKEVVLQVAEVYPFIADFPEAEVWDIERDVFQRQKVEKWGGPIRGGAPTHFPPFNWDVLMGLDDNHLVQLVNMSFKPYFADWPSSTYGRGRRDAKTNTEVWEDNSNHASKPAWTLLPLLPAYYATQIMKVHPCRDDPRKIGQLMVLAPEGDCKGKQTFVDKELSAAPIRTCCFRNCPEHPVEPYPPTEGRPKGGPEIVWTVFQAQHWGKSRLHAEALDRFMEEVDNRSDVHAYLHRVARLRKDRLRARQGIEGTSKLRTNAVH